MAEQRLGVDAGELFFADRERHHWNVLRGDALVAELLADTNVGVAAADRVDAPVFLPAEPNFLMSATIVCQSECPNGV